MEWGNFVQAITGASCRLSQSLIDVNYYVVNLIDVNYVVNLVIDARKVC